MINAGVTVTITGGSLYPIPYQTTARIGARAGVMGSAQNTQLAFVVPTLAASGKVSVSTPYGMASRAQDLWSGMSWKSGLRPLTEPYANRGSHW